MAINTTLKSRAQTSLGQLAKELTFWSLLALLIAAPIMRGLFYEIEFLKAQMYIGGVLLLYIFNRVLNREDEVGITLLDGFVLAFLVAYILSLLNAVHIKEAIWGAFKVLNYVLIFFIVSDLAKEKRKRRQLIAVIFLSTVIISATALLMGIDVLHIQIESEFSNPERVSSFLEYHNTFAIYAALGVMLGLGMLLSANKMLTKALSGCGVYLNLVALFASQSRASWLVFGVILLLWLAFIGKKHFWTNIYHVLALGLLTMVFSKGYMDAFYAKEYGEALSSLLLGLLLAAFISSFFAYLPSFLDGYRFIRKFKNALTWVIVIFVMTTGFVYFSYTAKYLPSSTSQLLSNRVISRAASIGGQDGSFITRMDLNRIALELVSDNPVLGTGEGGWEAFYHQYQHYSYWSSEVHNNFFQIWVEAGTLGFLAYIGVWFLLLGKFILYINERKKSGRWVQTYSIFLALLLLLIHSGMDFDLSMPAVAIALWVLGGVLYSETKSYAEKHKVFALPAMATISIALVICALLTYPAWREYKSCYLVKEGDYALHMGYYPRAIDKYEEAFKLSPLSGGIAAKLAQSYAGRVQSSSENDYNEEFNYYVDKTHSLHPWSEVSSWNLIDAFKLKGDRLQRLEEEERYVSIVPSWVPGIERLAEGYLAEGLTKLESGNVAEAEKYFELCYQMIERINENYLQSGKKSNMKVTPKGYALAGESALLLNNTEDAVFQLTLAEKYSQTKPLAQTLLALAYKKIDEQKHLSYYDQYVRNSADNTAVYDRYKNLLEKTGG